MNRNDTGTEINLFILLKHLQKKVWVIVAITVIFAVLGLLISMLLITPEYTASTRIYVLHRKSENSVAASDFQSSNYIVYDYKELITGRNVTQEVIKQLGLRMSSGALSQKISVSSPQNTRILHISVTDTDPLRAQQLANTVREVAAAQLKDIMQVDSVTTIYEAGVPSSPSGPNSVRNAILAGILGFTLTVGIYIVIFIVDDRIRTEEDAERYLGLSILGVIPNAESLANRAAPKRKTPSGQSRGRGK